MATDYNTLKVTYGYNRIAYNELTLRYSYSIVSTDTNNLGLTYSFDALDHSSSDKMAGYWSDHTQLICNALPYWHAGRHNQTSSYQQFINGLAINEEYLYDQFLTYRKNGYLDTVESDLSYSGYISDYPKQLTDISDRYSDNILYNSDFSIPGRALSDYPCQWAVDKSTGAVVTIESDPALSAGNSLSIKTNSGEYATIYQSYNARYPVGQDLVLSAMVNVPNNSSSVDSNASSSAAIHLDILYVDGSSEKSSIDIPLSTTEEGILDNGNTSQISYWKRINKSVSLTKPSAYVKCYIEVDYRNNTSDMLMYIDCIQLEEGTVPSSWKVNSLDNLPWIYNELQYSPSPYSVYSNDTSAYTQSAVVLNTATSYMNIQPKTKLFYCNSEQQFYDDAIPTALSSISVSTEISSSVSIKGVVTNTYDTLISSVKWQPDPVNSSKIKKTSFELNDDHGSFAIAERDYFGDDTNKYTVIKDYMSSGAETYTLAIRALTVDHDYLVAFCRESLGTAVYYTFKFISPKKGFQGTYLECIQDFRVPDATASLFDTGVETGTVLFNQIGKVEGSRSKFVIETNDGVIKYETDFVYDYYIDAGDGQFFTREKYDQICVT